MEKVDEIWAEEDLIKRLYLPSKEGRSKQIGHWVAKGLKCVTLSGKRYFREEDLVGFFNDVANGAKKQE